MTYLATQVLHVNIALPSCGKVREDVIRADHQSDSGHVIKILDLGFHLTEDTEEREGDRPWLIGGTKPGKKTYLV